MLVPGIRYTVYTTLRRIVHATVYAYKVNGRQWGGKTQAPSRIRVSFRSCFAQFVYVQNFIQENHPMSRAQTVDADVQNLTSNSNKHETHRVHITMIMMMKMYNVHIQNDVRPSKLANGDVYIHRNTYRNTRTNGTEALSRRASVQSITGSGKIRSMWEIVRALALCATTVHTTRMHLCCMSERLHLLLLLMHAPAQVAATNAYGSTAYRVVHSSDAHTQKHKHTNSNT